MPPQWRPVCPELTHTSRVQALTLLTAEHQMQAGREGPVAGIPPLLQFIRPPSRRNLAGRGPLAEVCRRGSRRYVYSTTQEENVKRLTAVAMVAAVSGLAWNGALAAEHEVRMLNKGPEGQPMQFDPAFLKIEPGDSVKFVATDKGHNSESIKEMLPEGVEPWKGKINEEVTVTFDVEGIYGYKCLPHFAMGMVGLIQVGDGRDNLDSAETAKLPGKAKTRMAELTAEVGSGTASDGD